MVVQAGRIVDAADYTPGLGLGVSAYVVKATNESLSSSTTLQADNDLVLALAVGTYEVEVFLIVTGPAATAIKTAWTVPSGATGSRLCVGPTPDAASFSGQAEMQARMSAHGWGTSVSYSVDTLAVAIVERGPLVVTTAGTLTLTWAQVPANATATVVGANSYLKVTRIA